MKLTYFIPDCFACSCPSWALFCSRCFEEFSFKDLCFWCGRAQVGEELCGDCDEQSKDVHCSFVYEGPVRDWIQRIKLGGRFEMWAELRDSYLPNFSTGFDFLIPICSDPRKTRRRGFDNSSYLAKRLGRLWGVPVLDKVFERREFIVSESSMEKAQRAQMMERLIKLSNCSKISGRRVLLVDDVMTTGVSMRLCERLLRAAGAQPSLYVVARRRKLYRRMPSLASRPRIRENRLVRKEPQIELESISNRASCRSGHENEDKQAQNAS